MDVKRLTRGPAIWVIVFVVLLIIGARVFAPNQFKKVDTYQAINLIKSDSVVSAKIVDRDQRLELTLKDSAKIDGYAKVTTYYVAPRGADLVDLLNENQPADGFNDDVPPARGGPACCSAFSRSCCWSVCSGS